MTDRAFRYIYIYIYKYKIQIDRKLQQVKSEILIKGN